MLLRRGRRKDLSVRAARYVLYAVISLALLGGAVGILALRPGPNVRAPIVNRIALRPANPAGLDAAPPEVQDFLHRVLDKIPSAGDGFSGYDFQHWEWGQKPTHEVIGLKAVAGVDPNELIKRVMDVDGYEGRIAHVDICRSEDDSAYKLPEKVRFHQVIRVPRIAKVQQELVLVDAGTVKGYRVAYWYLLKDQTQSLDPKVAARSEYNVGAWLAAPGVVGYALSSWPRHEDVNAFQWATLTSGANALAKKVVEGNIDGMAAWAKQSSKLAQR